MEIKICHNQEEWNKKLLEGEKGLRQGSGQVEFLQSWEWGEFQESVGNRTVRLIGDGFQAQGFVHGLPGLGKYLYLPRIRNYPASTGPRFGGGELGIMNELVEYCRKNNYIFLRLESVEKINLQSAIYNLQSVKNRQPWQTLILDLSEDNNALLAAMHPKTRYNIHVAEKHGVEVRQEKNIEVFWQLNLETIGRDKFKSHEKKYYEKMLKLDICHQLTAYYKNKPIASNILIAFDDTTTYLHGASASDLRNLMATYLLQWEGIKLAQKLNCQYYDFWGVAPLQLGDPNNSRFRDCDDYQCFNNYCWDKNHSWSGVTRFKVGFGGVCREYPEACDIILKPFYYKLYQLAKKIL